MGRPTMLLYWYQATHLMTSGMFFFTISAQFSQMVWANSVKFGCGKARSRTGKIIVVANYEPKVTNRTI